MRVFVKAVSLENMKAFLITKTKPACLETAIFICLCIKALAMTDGKFAHCTASRTHPTTSLKSCSKSCLNGGLFNVCSVINK